MKHLRSFFTTLSLLLQGKSFNPYPRNPAEAASESVQSLEQGHRLRQEGGDIGLERALADDEATTIMIKFKNDVLELAKYYEESPRLKRARFPWPRGVPAEKGTKAPLPVEYEERLISYLEKLSDMYNRLDNTNVSQKRLKGLIGATEKGMDPKVFGAGDFSPRMIELSKRLSSSDEKAIAHLNAYWKAEIGPTIKINPLTKAVSLIWRTPRYISDLIVENMISQNSTWQTVNLATAARLIDRAIESVMLDIVRGVKKITTPKSSIHAEINSTKNLFNHYISNFMSANKNWWDTITGRADANLFPFNAPDRQAFALDALKGHGNMRKLQMKYRESRFYKAANENGFKHGWALAQVPDYLLRGLNSIWGVGKLQATDVWFKSLNTRAEIAHYAELEELARIRQKHAVAGTSPSMSAIKRDLDIRREKAFLNYETAIPDEAVTKAMDSMNRGLYRSKQAKVIGTEDINLGDGLRSISNAVKKFGSVGRLASVFLEVAVNGSDYFIQRLPGINWINPTIRKEWSEFGSDTVIAKSMTGALMSMVGSAYFLKNTDKMSVTNSMEDRKRFREVYGHWPAHNVVIQMPLFNVGNKQYIIDPLMPLGGMINYGMTLSHYMDKFGKNKDFSELIGDSMLQTVKQVTPLSFFENMAGFFGWFEELGKSEKSVQLGTLLGSTTTKLLNVGLIKEWKDFSRGYKTKADSRLGTVMPELDSIIEDQPINKNMFYGLNMPRVANHVLPISDLDTGTEPPTAWNGYQILTREDKSNISDFKDYLAHTLKIKSANISPINKFLYTIGEDMDEKINLSPTQGFNLNGLYQSQLFNIYSDNTPKRDIAMLMSSDDRKSEKEFKFSEDHHRKLTRLSAGFPVSVDIVQNGKPKTVKISWQNDLKRLSNLDYNKISKDYSSGNNVDYSAFIATKKDMESIYRYGASKEGALIRAVNENHFKVLQKKIESFNKTNVPLNWEMLRSNVQSVMKTDFKDSIGRNRLDSAEGRIMFNRLAMHFDQQGKFSEGLPERIEQYKSEMIESVNEIVNPYNNVAKLLFLYKAYGQSDDFMQKIYTPEKEKAIIKMKTGTAFM